MKKKAKLLLEKSISSLILTVEFFNRPYEDGRCEAILSFANHSFEMLLKSLILEKTGKIRKSGEKLNYTFEKCVDICKNQLNSVSVDEAIILKNINGFRDAAQHDLIFISEGVLFNHIQSGVEIFKKILSKDFQQNLSKYLPSRVLPISTVMPKNIQILLQMDLEDTKKLLSGKKRKEDEAEAKLRTLYIIEKNLQSAHGTGVEQKPLSSIVKQIKKGTEIGQLFPMSANLSQTTEGLQVSLQVTKTEGLPVRIDQNSDHAIAFKYIKPEDKYPYLTYDLAKKLELTPNKLLGIIKVLNLKEDDKYFTSIKTGPKSKVSRYSQKSLDLIKLAIRQYGIDNLWSMSKENKKIDAKTLDGF